MHLISFNDKNLYKKLKKQNIDNEPVVNKLYTIVKSNNYDSMDKDIVDQLKLYMPEIKKYESLAEKVKIVLSYSNNLLTTYSLENTNKTIDQAILYAILKAEKKNSNNDESKYCSHFFKE